MADVFLAVASGPAGLGFSKLVVIKRLREHLANDPEFVGMLVDEARIAARLNHPNVVQTIEIGEADGQYFLAMEYLEGQSLRRIMNKAAASPLGAAFSQRSQYTVLADVLAGLHHAHELTDYDKSPLQIVHRDVTPHNVFVTYEGQVKVVDFGIAKAVGRVSETRHGVIKGKVAYMAPEQAKGLPVDRRADLFSVGVMLWEAAVGARMWAHKDETHILRQLVRGDVPSSPRAVRGDVPEAIETICRRALSAQREERYPTAAEFEAALVGHLDSVGGRASDRELGRGVCQLFDDARKRAKTIIDSQLAELGRATSSSSFKMVPVPPESAPSSHSASLSVAYPAENTLMDRSSATLAVAAAQAAPAWPGKTLHSSRKKRRGWFAPGLLGIAVIAGLAWTARQRLRRPLAVQSPPAAQDAAVSSASASGSAEQAPVDVTVTLRAMPLQARFSIDDGPSLPNPYVGKHARDGEEHRITVTAPGFTTLSQAVTFDEDVALQLSMARAEDADTSPQLSPKRPPRRR